MLTIARSIFILLLSISIVTSLAEARESDSPFSVEITGLTKDKIDQLVSQAYSSRGDSIKLNDFNFSLSSAWLGRTSIRLLSGSLSNSNANSSSNQNEEALFLGRAEISGGRSHAANPVAFSLRLSNDPTLSYLRLTIYRKVFKGQRSYEITIPLTKITNSSSFTLRLRSAGLSGLYSHGFEAPPVQAAANASSSAATVCPTDPETVDRTYLKQFTLFTYCDQECYYQLQQTGSNGQVIEDANTRVAEFVNVFNVIYSSQLGIKFQITGQAKYQPSLSVPDPLDQIPGGTDLTAPDNLLNLWTTVARTLPSADLKHLVTGKAMQHGVVGYSWVGAACVSPNYAFGYDEIYNTLFTPIIMAHEIGHNLGADHDPQSEGIMAAVLRQPLPTQFSECSARQILGFIRNLGPIACYDKVSVSNGSSSSSTSKSSSSNSSSSSTSSSSSNSNGTANSPPDSSSSSASSISTTAGSISANFKSTSLMIRIHAPKGHGSCSAKVELGDSIGNLGRPSSLLKTFGIRDDQVKTLMVANAPRVVDPTKAVSAFYNVVFKCSGPRSAALRARSIGIAIPTADPTNFKTTSSVKSWIALIKRGIRVG